MSKRQEMREKRRREKIRNQIFTILLVVGGAVLITFALIVPGIRGSQNASATATAAINNPVVVVTPTPINALVDGVHLGDPNAPVKVDIYEDFRCSACKTYTETIEPSIIQAYVDTGLVYYTFHNYIVIDNYDQTDASYTAALAGMCAADQNLFWEYHQTLYANQVTEEAFLFTNERLTQMAQNVGIEVEAFNQCLDDKVHEDTIQSDTAQYEALVASQADTRRFTPSVFVNGVRAETSLSAISAAIEAALNGQ